MRLVTVATVESRGGDSLTSRDRRAGVLHAPVLEVQVGRRSERAPKLTAELAGAETCFRCHLIHGQAREVVRVDILAGWSKRVEAIPACRHVFMDDARSPSTARKPNANSVDGSGSRESNPCSCNKR